MTRAVADFDLLCQCLGGGAPPSRSRLDGANWDRVVELADRESVGPTLWAALEAKGLLSLLPSATRRRLTMQHHLNGVKNDHLREQAVEIAVALNALEITPMLLKGGVSLFEAPVSNVSTRVMHDLDIAVHSADLALSIETLQSLGYDVEEQGDGWTYQYWPMFRPSTIAPIEIHTLIGEQKQVLPVELGWERAERLPCDDASMVALAPTHRLIHNILHSQVQDRGHELGFIYLKQLVDLVSISRNPTVDWTELADTFRRHGLSRTLRYRLYMAERLLGLETPLGSSRSFGASVYFERCLMSVRSKKYRDAVLLLAGATQPFKKQHMKLRYNVDDSFVSLNLQRLRHAGHLLREHRGQIWGLIRARRGLYE